MRLSDRTPSGGYARPAGGGKTRVNRGQRVRVQAEHVCQPRRICAGVGVVRRGAPHKLQESALIRSRADIVGHKRQLPDIARLAACPIAVMEAPKRNLAVVGASEGRAAPDFCGRIGVPRPSVIAVSKRPPERYDRRIRSLPRRRCRRTLPVRAWPRHRPSQPPTSLPAVGLNWDLVWPCLSRSIARLTPVGEPPVHSCRCRSSTQSPFPGTTKRCVPWFPMRPAMLV